MVQKDLIVLLKIIRLMPLLHCYSITVIYWYKGQDGGYFNYSI